MIIETPEKRIVSFLLDKGYSEEEINEVCGSLEFDSTELVRESTKILKPSLEDFERCFKNDSLGNLYFPNGKEIPKGFGFDTFSDFHISLKDLYKIVFDRRFGKNSYNLEDIFTVLVFGKSVQSPDYDEVIKTRKKYLFFGPPVDYIKKIKVHPDIADFLIITNSGALQERILNPVYETYDIGHGEAYFLTKGGIHLISKSIEEISKEIKEDNIYTTIMLETGVPLFSEREFSNFLEKNLMERKTPREIFWKENEKEYLIGKIL